jgi:uncharacterized SAM-binding protein YcdF (DUF218 family)
MMGSLAVNYTEPLTPIVVVVLWIGVSRLAASRLKLWLLAALTAATLLTWPPVEWLLSRHLEAAYPVQPFRVPPGVQAIVVLSSDVSPAQFERPYALPDQETFNRCRHAAWIYRNSQLPVLVSGGGGKRGIPPFSVAMRELLLNNGVPPGQIWVEEGSVNTHGNALRSAKILREHGVQRIALVVDARSMRRAEACFRKEGIDVAAAPSKFMYLSANLQDWLPGWRAIRGNELTLHETAGLLLYRWRGWI